MTVEELKSALLDKEFPSPVQIDEHQIVLEPTKFLRIQFTEIDNWKRDLIKCPAYVRLLSFYEAVK